jgi:hypothetical protein
LERKAYDRSIGIEEADRLSCGVDLRVGHKSGTIHLNGTFLPEDASEFVLHELSVGVVVDFGLRVTYCQSRLREKKGRIRTHSLTIEEIVRVIFSKAILVGLVEESGNESLGVGGTRVS